MLSGVFQYSKASQNAGIHVAPQNLMTSWQAHKGPISSTTRNQRLMKSHRRFLRPGKRQCLQAFTIGETHTLASPPLCCIQSSAWCILLSIFDRNMHWCHETEWSCCSFIGNYPEAPLGTRPLPWPRYDREVNDTVNTSSALMGVKVWTGTCKNGCFCG